MSKSVCDTVISIQWRLEQTIRESRIKKPECRSVCLRFNTFCARLYTKMTKKSLKTKIKNPKISTTSFLAQNWAKNTMHTFILPKNHGKCPNYDFLGLFFVLGTEWVKPPPSLKAFDTKLFQKPHLEGSFKINDNFLGHWICMPMNDNFLGHWIMVKW